MARKRKKKKLPKTKRFSLFNQDLSLWSDEQVRFFFMVNPTLHRAYSRQSWKGKLSEEEARSTVRFVFNNYDSEILALDIKALHKGYLTLENDANWHKRFYREIVVLVNMYLSELKTGEELYSPPANLPVMLDDRWVFHGYQFSDLEEELIMNFNTRYVIHSLYGGKTLKELHIDPSITEEENPIQFLIELITKLP